MRWQVTFNKLSPESSLERDASISEPHPLTWSEWRLGDQSNWSRTEEDLECLPPLDPHLEGFLAGAERGDDSQLTLSPKPSFNNSSKWVKWHAEQLKTLTWWWELSEVPSQMDIQEFAWQVQVSFQVPKASSCTQEVTNDYSALLAPHSLDQDWFLPLSNMKFCEQDYHMKQPQKTLAYTKALQYWVEKAQPPPPSEPHQLAESILELRWTMEPLTTFTNTEVLDDAPPSNCVKITSSWTLKYTDPPTPWEWSHNRNSRAWARGTFTVACGIGQWKPTASAPVASPSPTPTQKAEPWQEVTSSQLQIPPPGFMEIARSLNGDDSPCVVTGVPPELAKEQDLIQVAGSTMLSARLFQYVVSDYTYIDMVTCLMSLVGLGFTSLAVDHSMPALLGEEDMDSD